MELIAAFFASFFVLPFVYTVLIIFVLFFGLVAAVSSDDDGGLEGLNFLSFILGPVGITAFLYFGTRIHFTAETFKLLVPSVLVYALAGGVWSVIKWFGFVRRWESRKLEDIRRSTRFDAKRAPDLEAPSPSTFKGQITFWIAYWPFSLFGSFFKTFITGFVHRVRDLFSGFYESISKRSSGKVQAAYEQALREAEAEALRKQSIVDATLPGDVADRVSIR